MEFLIELSKTLGQNALILELIIAFLVGGGVTVGGIAVRNPIGDRIKNRLIKVDYVLGRYNSLDSYHAITAVLTVVTDDTTVPNQVPRVEASLNGVSQKALNFFGKLNDDASRKSLLNVDGGELLQLLQPYMDEDDYLAFCKDQSRVIQEYAKHEPAIAQVPVIFNQKHTQPGFRGRAFLPVIVTLGEDRAKGKNSVSRIIQIAYLDVEELTPAIEEYSERMDRKRQTTPD